MIGADTDVITAQARAFQFWPTVLNALAWLLIGIGRIAYAVLAVTWLAACWVVVAVRQGWRDQRAADAAKRAAAQQARLR